MRSGSAKPATSARPRAAWHVLPFEQVLRELASREGGLTTHEARERLARDGPNELSERATKPAWQRFLAQFRSPLIYVLLVAAVISFFVGERWDPYVILAIVAINGVIGFLQESRAEQALAALRRMTSPHARVLREGHHQEIPASEVVVGDMLILESGDRAAADARLLSANELHLDESTLTGESVPVHKSPAPLGDPDLPLGDRLNLVYMNTSVTGGRGRAVVVATGMATEMGAIAEEVAGVESVSPLLRQFARFSRMLGMVILAVVALVLALGVYRGLGLSEMFVVALSMAVSAIPEGLPIVVSVLLAVGVWRMARRKALIRHLPAVESLGAATVICTDKTGTLTRNEMTVQRLYAGGRLARVTGEGYSPLGAIEPEDGPIEPSVLHSLMAGAALCNDAVLEEVEGAWRVLGDPTEGALQTLALKAGFEEDWRRLSEVPFSSERRWMATLHERPDSSRVVLLKGALEALSELAAYELDGSGRAVPLTAGARERWHEAFAAMASEAMRVLAIAMVSDPDCPAEDFGCWSMQGRVTLVGLVGMIDPPRPEAIRAIATCQAAGIRVVMITGDHRATAEAIGRRMGILAEGGQALEGAELERLTERELAGRLEGTAVFARVAPAHKLRLVRALQAEGQIVAMTGDGVNDAPALRQADIGVAMGVAGTEVAKGAADMVLADDNFATIVAAVEEGRTISANMRKVIQYLLTTGAGEIMTVSVAVILGLPLPLMAVQILWINMVTDGVLDKTFALERGDPDLMRQPPQRPGTPLVTRSMVLRLLFVAALMAAATIGVYVRALDQGAAIERARSMAFMTLVACQWFAAFTFRALEKPLWTVGLHTNPWMLGGLVLAIALQLLALYTPVLQMVLHTVPLSPGELGVAIAAASTVFFGNELRKVLLKGIPRS